MNKLFLYLKGFCMGVADVIPGVSGGTMALILRIYRRLIASIEELNLRWINSLLSWVFDDSEDSTASKNQLLKDLRSLNLDFFIPLGFGIVSALGVGSIVLPPLLSNYPVAMRSFFFGLILASVWIPFSMIDEGSRLNVYRMAIFFFLMLAGGYYVTNPAHQILVPVEWEKMSSTGGTLEEILNKAPSAYPAEPVFWSENNQELRKKIQNSQPEKFQTLRRSHESFSEAMLLDRDQIKSRSETYHSIQVPSEVSVYVPGIPYWYVFFAGVLAISAMILPGISGAYILLILGTYFFYT